MAFQRMIIRPIPTHDPQKTTPSHPVSSGSSQTPIVLFPHHDPCLDGQGLRNFQRQSRGPRSHRGGSLRLAALLQTERVKLACTPSVRPPSQRGRLLHHQPDGRLCVPSPALSVQFTKAVGAPPPTQLRHPGSQRKGGNWNGRCSCRCGCSTCPPGAWSGCGANRPSQRFTASEQALFSSTRLTQARSWPAAGSQLAALHEAPGTRFCLNSNTG